MPEIPVELAWTADRLEGLPLAQRIAALVGFAADFEEVPSAVAERPFPEANRVPGCESDIYVWAVDRPDGTLKFHFAVGNPQGISARAMAVILGRSLSGQPVDEVARVRPDIASRLFGGWQAMGGARAGLTGMMTMTARAAARRRGGWSAAELRAPRRGPAAGPCSRRAPASLRRRQRGVRP